MTSPPPVPLRPLRLGPGEDPRRALEALAADGLARFVVAGIGSLEGARLRLAAADREAVLEGPFEIVSLSGSVTADGAHLHMAVADAQGRVTGGHVVHGNVVRTTVELLLAELPGWSLGRELDTRTGYEELVVRGPAAGGAGGAD